MGIRSDIWGEGVFRRCIREELTSGDAGISSLFGDIIRDKIREELSSGDATVSSPLLQELVESTHNAAAVTANSAIFTDYTVPYDCILRVIIALDPAAVLSYTLKRDTAAVVFNLNGGSTLTAKSAYAFDIPVKNADVVNFQVDKALTVIEMSVFKIRLTAP